MIQESIQTGRENTPGCGASGIGAPPLISTIFVTRRARRRPNAAANAHLTNEEDFDEITVTQ